MSTRVETEDVWATIQNDKYLSQFVSSSVEEAASGATASIHVFSLTASEQLAKLTKGIYFLDKELQSVISRNYSDLISQGTGVYMLAPSLEIIRTHIQALMTSVEDVRRKLSEPYSEIKKHCLILTRLHDTSNLLRCIDRVQKLAKNISAQEMLPGSLMMREVDEFCRDIDITGIDIIENDRRIVENERQRIRSTAKKSLIEALATENKKQANVSVQVFSNLKILEKEVQNLKNSALTAISQSTKAALDIQSLMNQASDPDRVPKFKSSGPGRVTGGTFPGVNVAAFRTKLWSNWDNLLENVVYPRCAEMYFLQLTISSQSESSLNSENYVKKKGELGIAGEFWSQVSEILSKQLISASEDSSFIKQALESEYPKLLRLHTELTKKLQKLMKKYPSGASNKNTNQLFQNSSEFANLFEHAYLSRSVSRLLDLVHGMFSTEGVPATEDIDKFMRMLADELKLSFIDENLCRTVAKNIGKAIRVFCINSERLVVHNGSSSQVIDVANATQSLNASIANTILYMKQGTERIFSKVPPKLTECCKCEITKEFSHADDLVNSIMQPLVNSISEAIESIILTLHKENYQGETVTEPVPCSLYMRELQRFISRTYNDYLKAFNHQELLQKHCFYLANRCVELFLRHICLVRPVTAGGRQKIVEDMKKIEIAIAPLCSEVKSLGDNGKILRAFRPLVVATEPQLVVNSEFIGKIVPYSLALMFLFSFAPPEIPSPHESCNWSMTRLSQWLDNHPSEHERLELVSGSLQRYQQTIRQQNRTTFHEVYPLMMNLLETGFKSLKYSA